MLSMVLLQVGEHVLNVLGLCTVQHFSCSTVRTADALNDTIDSDDLEMRTVAHTPLIVVGVARVMLNHDNEGAHLNTVELGGVPG